MTTRQQARRQEHLAQVRLQEERRTHGRSGHEATPADVD